MITKERRQVLRCTCGSVLRAQHLGESGYNPVVRRHLHGASISCDDPSLHPYPWARLSNASRDLQGSQSTMMNPEVLVHASGMSLP